MNKSKYRYRIIVDGRYIQTEETKTQALLVVADIFGSDDVKVVTIEKFEI